MKKRSTGSDGLEAKFLKPVTRVIMYPLAHLFNLTLYFYFCSFLSTWKSAAYISNQIRRSIWCQHFYQWSIFHLYADNTVIYISNSNRTHIQHSLQLHFNSAQDWLINNRLGFNHPHLPIHCVDGSPLLKVN